MAMRKYRLVWDREVIQKAVARYNGALSDSIDTVGPVSARLEEAMPMLRTRHIKVPKAAKRERDLTIEVTKSREVSSSSSETLIRNSSP